jgi:regulatory protein YycH of two-component signal transduction system YycFG
MDNIKFSTDISGKHSINGLPICEEETGRVVAVFYNDYDAEDVVTRINSHDALTARVAELEAVIKEADEYLDYNDMTSIGSGSAIHMEFKKSTEAK